MSVDGTSLWFDFDEPAMRGRLTVVLLHGGPGLFDDTYFKLEFALLTEVAQVAYLDLYGYGCSEWGKPSAWNFETAADLVRVFCSKVCWMSLWSSAELICRYKESPASLPDAAAIFPQNDRTG